MIMNRTTVRDLRFVFLLAAAASQMSAQRAKGPPRPAPVGEFDGRWSTVIDSEVTKLRLPVVATAAADLVKLLAISPKTDLETTADYAQRNATVAASRTYAVRIPINTSDDARLLGLRTHAPRPGRHA